MKQVITPEHGPKAAGPYSLGVKAHSLVFVSGQIPADPESGELVTGPIQAQTTRVIENLKLILEAGGISLEHVVKTTVFLKDMNDFAQMNETYGGFFSHHPPARTTVEVACLPRDVRIEIEAIAIDPHEKYPFAK